MRIERINENSIRCTLTSFDLSVRNLNLRELAYGSEKAKKLFDEMMTKAGNEVGFHAENMPIMATFRVFRMGALSPRFFWASFSQTTATAMSMAMMSRKLTTYPALEVMALPIFAKCVFSAFMVYLQ